MISAIRVQFDVLAGSKGSRCYENQITQVPPHTYDDMLLQVNYVVFVVYLFVLGIGRDGLSMVSILLPHVTGVNFRIGC